MTAPDRAAVEAAVIRLNAWLTGRRANVNPEISTTLVRAEPRDRSTAAYTIAEADLRTVLTELERLGRVEQERAFVLGHGGAWCTACHRAMREGTPAIKSLAVVCEPCGADLVETAGRFDPSRVAARNAADLAARDGRDGEPR